MKQLKIRFIANFPLSIVYGGFEHQCVQAVHALKSIGVDADFLNWHGTEKENFILHLFAPDPMWARIIEYWGHRNPVVISAIAGTRGFRLMSYQTSNVACRIAQLIGQETIYFRTRKLLHRVDRIICVNKLEQDYFIRNYDLPSNKTVIISHGVDNARYSTPSNIFVNKFGLSGFILFVGNIIRRKNPLLLAECLNELDLNGVFIGQPMSNEVEYSKAFENIISRSPKLNWINNLNYDDPLLSSAFAAAKVLCLPSVAETQPVVALEAMASGTPVILGDYPYAHQTPFEKTVKVNPVNKNDLKAAILKVVKQGAPTLEKLSTEYSWKKVAEKLLKVYSEF